MMNEETVSKWDSDLNLNWKNLTCGLASKVPEDTIQATKGVKELNSSTQLQNQLTMIKASSKLCIDIQ